MFVPYRKRPRIVVKVVPLRVDVSPSPARASTRP
jgi:hypothetical protein